MYIHTYMYIYTHTYKYIQKHAYIHYEHKQTISEPESCSTFFVLVAHSTMHIINATSRLTATGTPPANFKIEQCTFLLGGLSCTSCRCVVAARCSGLQRVAEDRYPRAGVIYYKINWVKYFEP